MLFLLLLVNVCIASQSHLEPISRKVTVPSRTKLALIAKKDPHALLKMLDNANPDDIAQIVQLLQELIDAGKTEKAQLAQSLSDAEATVTTAREAYNAAFIAQGTADAKHRAALDHESASKGTWEAATAAYDTEQPGLENEIAVFQQVLNILQNLLNQQPQDEALLELGSSEKGKLYQKLILKVQADPTKINQIIDLVNGLSATSESVLNSLEKTVNDTRASYDSAIDATTIASGELTAAQKETTDASDALGQAQGAFEETQKNNNDREAVIDSEETTLNEVITLLNQISDTEVVTPSPTPAPHL